MPVSDGDLHEAFRSARLYRLWQAFRWPDESVCGYDWCPQRKLWPPVENSSGYCLECHTVAYNAMIEARQWIIETMIALTR